MPVYGEEKRLQMARSVLISRGSVREDRQRAHRRARVRARAALRTASLGDGFDERPLGSGAQGEIADLVYLRRAWDKTAPFERWADAQAAELGSTPQSRLAAMRARLPKNPAGRHALSHLAYRDGFTLNPFSLGATARSTDLDSRDLQSLRDRLRRRLGQRLDRLGELNAVIKAAWAANPPEPGRRPRLLAGAHDIDAFAAHLVGHLEQRARRPYLTPPDPSAAAVLAFAGIDPTDPLARR
ncbi:MAG: hypothetical protein ACKVWR_03490 [Acidimicrobiales bacterium]